MKAASTKYKEAMNKMIRDRSYIMMSLGVINNEAQADASCQTNALDIVSAHNSIFTINTPVNQYATCEEDVFKADGSMYFPPETTSQTPLNYTGFITNDLKGGIVIDFSDTFDIKGLTLDFGEFYPTEFTVATDTGVSNTYTNDSATFTCEDAFDGVKQFTITPISFVKGDNKRLRINYVLMGIGLTFDNNYISSMSLTDENSFIAENLPSLNLECSFFDRDDKFDVDNPNSFLNYLETGQSISLSMGIETEDGSVEYISLPTTYLTTWEKQSNKMSLTSVDMFQFLDSDYLPSQKIHTRTLYDDAIEVLTAYGLEEDGYTVDSCLKDVTVTNPLPEDTFANLLQMICNAGRCILRQDADGKIKIKANFEHIIEPSDIEISVNEQADWSNYKNLLAGSDYIYADYSQDFYALDDSQYQLPDDTNYLETGFVSKEIADETGLFTNKPTITIKLPSLMDYYGLNLTFGGNPPQQITVKTYEDDAEISSTVFTEISKNASLYHEWTYFNKMVITFDKAYPNNRIVLQKLGFGNITDYTVRKEDMTENMTVSYDTQIKTLSVKVFTFETDSDTGEAKEVDDNVYYNYQVSKNGEQATFENQLISTESHAKDVAEWIGNYYANNIKYNISFRGEPRLDSGDIVFIDSDNSNNLLAEIESATIEFNNSLSGTLDLRRTSQTA